MTRQFKIIKYQLFTRIRYLIVALTEAEAEFHILTIEMEANENNPLGF